MRSTFPDVRQAGTVATALDDLAGGRMVVVVGGAERGFEADVVLAAEHATADAVNFMTRQAGGLILLALTPGRCHALGLRPLAPASDLALTPTIEARSGVTTGISTADQAHTIRTAADPAQGAGAIVVPGHVRPVRARAGGVLQRPGAAEAAVDLVRLAGLEPAAVLCGIQAADGTMARGAALEDFCARHGLARVTTAAVVAHRLDPEGDHR